MAERRWERAVVVGASSGIGRAIAEQLAAEGTVLALIARRGDVLAGLATELNMRAGHELARAFPHDVTDTAAVESLFQEITTTLGGLDLVVYAAGIMPHLALTEYPTLADIRTIETNFAGAVAWLNAAALRFDRAGSGTIIGISSTAGDRGRVGNPVYNATKAALTSYLESLRNRLARRGVTVVTAKPGFVQTPLVAGRPLPPFPPAISPEEAARLILSAAAAHKRVVYVPGWWRAIMLATRMIPAPLFERLNV